MAKELFFDTTSTKESGNKTQFSRTPTLFGSLDLAYSKNGDFILEKGDLKTTAWHPYESIRQEIRTRVGGSLGDWKLYPNITANADTELGKLCNEKTADLIKKRASYSLTHDGFLLTNNFVVETYPVGTGIIGIAVLLIGTSAGNNYKDENEAILFTANFSETNSGIVLVN
jgi:hypothetical protein